MGTGERKQASKQLGQQLAKTLQRYAAELDREKYDPDEVLREAARRLGQRVEAPSAFDLTTSDADSRRN